MCSKVSEIRVRVELFPSKRHPPGVPPEDEEQPLPQDAEEPEDRRRVGVLTRTGPGNSPLGVLFTDFSVHEITEE
jgi:hypothetical protein